MIYGLLSLLTLSRSFFIIVSYVSSTGMLIKCIFVDAFTEFFHYRELRIFDRDFDNKK